MIKVNNKKIIRNLSRRSLAAAKMRNIIAICAIALTAVLFTILFTIGGSMMKSMEQSTMRQVGTSSHGGFKYLTQEQYDIAAKDPKIKDISYNILVGLAENKKLNKIQTEIRYSEDKAAKWGFSYPETGKMPQKEMELATSTIVLDKLGIPHEIGQSVQLEFIAHGKKYIENFTLSGFWKGDRVSAAQQVWISRAFCNKVAPVISVPLYESGYTDYSGTINADVWFANSWNIEDKMAQLMERCGFDPQKINISINWAYTSAQVDFQTMVLILSVLVLILLSGYLIIYNIFYISVTRDIRFYGLLKTIGTTGKQLKKIVYRQGFLLSLSGIPIGLVMGWFIGWKLIPVILARTALAEDFTVSANPAIFAGSSLFTLLTVYISCIRPCHLAAKVSPVEAVRYTEGENTTKKSKKHNKDKIQRPSRKVSPVSMAFANLRRSRKKAVAVVISLSLSMILLNGVYTIANGFDMDKYLRNNIVSDFSVTHFSIGKFVTSHRDIHGVTPEVQEEIKSLKGLEDIGNIYMNENSYTLDEKGYENIMKIIDEYPDAFLMPHTEETLRMAKERRQMGVKVFGLNKFGFEKIDIFTGNVDWDKFNNGNYVIINAFVSGEDKGRYYDIGDKVMLDFGDGKTKEYEVLAIGELPYALGPKYSMIFDANFLLPDTEFLAQYGKINPLLTIFDVDEAYNKKTEEWIKDYCENVNPDLTYFSKATYEEEFHAVQSMFLTVGGAVSFILALIGILNFINSVVTSILARRKEFAVLQSIGMTGSQLKKMLISEGLIYAGLTILFASTAGVGIGYLLVQAIAGQIWFFTWYFTLLPIAYCIPVLILISMAIPVISYRTMCRPSIVERLREAE